MQSKLMNNVCLFVWRCQLNAKIDEYGDENETCPDLRVSTKHNPGEPKNTLGCAGIVFLWIRGKMK